MRWPASPPSVSATAAAALTLVLLSAAPAAAQPAPDVTEARPPDTAAAETALEEARRLNEESLRLLRSGKIQEGLRLAQRVVALVEQALGPEHPAVAANLHGLALLYHRQGDLAAAEPLYRRAAAIWERALGPEHPNVATCLSNLAELLRVKADYAAAEPIYRRALAMRAAALGPTHRDTATVQNNLALLLHAKGDYAAAVPLFRQALASLEQALGPEHPEIGKLLSNLADCLRVRGAHGEAEALCRRAVAIHEKAQVPGQADLALSLNNLAMILQARGDAAAAEAALTRALAIWEQTLPPEHPHIAACLGNLALIWQARGRYLQAEAGFRRALAIREKIRGPAHPEVARSLANLSVLLQAKGDLGAAEPLYLRALAIWEGAVGRDHPHVAVCLANLGSLRQALGDFDVAEQHFRRALAIQERALGPRHPDNATVVSNLGNLFLLKGNYVAAEAQQRQALALREETLGPTHPATAVSLNNLALVLHHGRADFPGAEALYRRALNVLEQALGSAHPEVANTIGNYAQLLRDKGDHAAAIPMFRRAIATCERGLGAEHPSCALILNNLAGALFDGDDRKQAEPLLRRAEAILEAALGPAHPNVAMCMNNLAELLRRERRMEEGEALQRKVLALREAALGPDHPDVAMSLNNLAMFRHAAGDLPAATPLYRRALGILETALGPDHPSVARTVSNLGEVLGEAGDSAEAERCRRRRLDIEDRRLRRMLTLGAERERRAFAATMTASTHFAVSQHVLGAPDAPPAAELALRTILQRKGRVLDSLTLDRQQLRASLGAEGANLFDELASIHAELSALAARPFGPKPAAALHKRRMELSSRAETLEATLADRSAELRALLAPVTVDSVRAALPADAVLVEFFRYRPHNLHAPAKGPGWGAPRYVAYLLRRAGPTVWADLGPASEIEDAVAKARAALTQPRSLTAKVALRNLSRRVLAPLERPLGGAGLVLIAADGVLHGVPFEALVDAQGRPAIETLSLHYIGSGRDLLAKPSTAPRQPAVVVTNPDFAFASPKSPRAPLPSRRSRSAGGATWADLPGTKVEGEALARLLPGATAVTRGGATETLVKAVRSPEVLHLATHGFFYPDQTAPAGDRPPRDAPPTGELAIRAVDLGRVAAADTTENPLLRAGLVLAGASRLGSGLDDGMLTALEVGSIDLRGTRLVVLSACDTGRGDVENGEGVFGLRRALAMAGAESVVMSLWHVDDQATQTLMESFYRRWLAGVSRLDALRQAKLELMRQPGRQHPYYWAAFVAIGAWGPLR